MKKLKNKLILFVVSFSFIISVPFTAYAGYYPQSEMGYSDYVKTCIDEAGNLSSFTDYVITLDNSGTIYLLSRGKYGETKATNDSSLDGHNYREIVCQTQISSDIIHINIYNPDTKTFQEKYATGSGTCIYFGDSYIQSAVSSGTLSGYFCGSTIVRYEGKTSSLANGLHDWFLANPSYNPGSDETDSGLSSEDLEIISNKISNIYNYLQYLEGKIDTVSSDVSSLNSDIDALNSKFTSVIDYLKTINSTLSSNLSSINSSLKDIKTYYSGISSSLSTIADYFPDILQELVNVNSNIISFKETVVTEFTNLKLHITDEFTLLKNYITSYFDVKFTELYNVIMYCNKDGVYEREEYQEKLSDYSAQMDDVNVKISSASDVIGSSSEGVVSYISTFTQFYEGIFALNFGLSGILTFALAVIFVKKVIGR